MKSYNIDYLKSVSEELCFNFDFFKCPSLLHILECLISLKMLQIWRYLEMENSFICSFVSLCVDMNE